MAVIGGTAESLLGAAENSEARTDPDFSIALIPDSQYLMGAYNPPVSEWKDQIRWIVGHAAAEKIKAVIHVGDLVDLADDRELSNALAGLNMLRAANCPFILAPGNHDCDGGGDTPQQLSHMTRAGLTPAWFSNYSNFGQGWTMGFENPTNLIGSYLLFTNGAQPYLIIALAWLPDQTTMLWASNVAETFGNVPCIYAQHAFVDSDPAGMRLSWDSVWSVERALGERGPWLTPNALWSRWISRTPNIFWVASGHTVPYTFYGVDAGNNCNYFTEKAADGHNILQTLCDFQNYETTIGRGTNYFQLTHFRPAQNTAHVTTIAPTPSIPLQHPRNGSYSWTPFFSASVAGTPWQMAVDDAGHLLLYLNFDQAPAFRDLSPFAAHLINFNDVARPTALGQSIWCPNTKFNILTVGASWPMIKARSHEKAELNQFANLSNFTVSVWFNTTNLNNVGTTATLVSKFDRGTHGDWYLALDNPTQLHFVTVNASLKRVDLTASVPNMADGNWRHAAAVYDGAAMKLYLDSALVGSAQQSGILQMTPLPVSIGADDTFQAGAINGFEDEIKIASVAWTPEQVSQEYSRVKAMLSH